MPTLTEHSSGSAQKSQQQSASTKCIGSPLILLSEPFRRANVSNDRTIKINETIAWQGSCPAQMIRWAPPPRFDLGFAWNMPRPCSACMCSKLERSFVQFLHNRVESSNRAEKPTQHNSCKFTTTEILAGGVRFRPVCRISRHAD